MFTFIILYFLNLVLDYPLQGTFLAEYKCKNNYILLVKSSCLDIKKRLKFWLVHCAIWALGIYIALYFLGLATVWKLVMLLVGHYLIDYWKCRGLYKKYMKDFTAYYIDQSLHIVQVLLCLI